MTCFKDLKTLVEINSWTHNKQGVDQNGRLMMEWLTALGFIVEVHHRDTIGNHLLFSTNQSRSSQSKSKQPESEQPASKQRLLLLGHLDTVFPPNTFEGFSEDSEWIYGPGVCDMKGGNFVALQALRTVFQETGNIENIDFLLVSDEETGSDDSRELTKALAANYSACIDFEAAGENHEVVVGRKGVATYQIDFLGKAAHAGNNYLLGHDANLAAATMLVALTQLSELESGTTVNVGKIEGGIGANTISPKAKIIVEARFTSKSEQQRVLLNIEEIAKHSAVEGVSTTVSGGLQRDVMSPSDAQSDLLTSIESALGYSLPTECRGGVSDANVVSGTGVATLDGFGPFGDGDHTIHERALKTSFTRRIEEVTKILKLYIT